MLHFGEEIDVGDIEGAINYLKEEKHYINGDFSINYLMATIIENM